MKISYDFFKRKFERNFMIGVYPEFCFNWNNKRYCINADLEKCYLRFIKPNAHLIKREEVLNEDTYRLLTADPYLVCDYIEIGKYSTLDELVANEYIDDNRVRDIWDDLDFIELESDFQYYFDTRESVLIKKSGEYGIVEKIEEKNGKVIFWIDTDVKNRWEEDHESRWISCEADDLEYDERPETINDIKKNYADYLYRISH